VHGQAMLADANNPMITKAAIAVLLNLFNICFPSA
jgi:hypothetical protein